MKDLFSFRRYAVLKQQAQMDDVEAGDTTVDLTQFFEEVDAVKQDLAELDSLCHRLHNSNEEAKGAYDATTVKAIRAGMDKDVEIVLRRAKVIKGKLEALERSNVAHRNLPGCGPGSSSDRARMSVVPWLRKKLRDLIEDFQDLRMKISAEYKETVGRPYYTVIGPQPGEQIIEKLLSSGESEKLVQKAMQEQGGGQASDTISDIQERHGAVKEMERSLLELHQVFMDMAVLVEVREQQNQNIESYVLKAISFVRSDVRKVEAAKTLQRSRRKWMCIAIAIALVVVVVVLVPVLVIFTTRGQ